MYKDDVSISIVVPCYNCEKTLSRTINSIIEQKCKVFQLVLVDDGSTDSTVQICNEYAEKDDRIKVIHQNNMGLMRAWKNGVLAADGDYIAFCDADDYVEKDYVDIIYENIDGISPDMILFGITIDYPNGKSVKNRNRLDSGIYSKDDLENKIFPWFFSNGEMQSEIILKSRWSKCYSKDLLLRIMSNLPDRIAIGEDWITVFASVLNANTIMCDNEHTCYHYYRNDQSMTGSYIDNSFEKLSMLYSEMHRIAQQYGYIYENQILADELSMYMVYIKKELQLNPNGYVSAKKRILELIENENFLKCKRHCSVKKYGLKERAFSHMIFRKWIFLAYIITKLWSEKRA
ncbi:glycosyltransferase family 2 protein [Butyrivibrio sp. INlla16]|uniref:glycosyltransferase family 2 protein n=1 Tax=Butyrivibrio sp. INlla16 TaxID=1520807 RepID=UPI00087E0A44|nr:glycosyltransferase family 2 protein [Butyrivibrio sp. INlla16]SDB62998.1 Glycosyl transferase family 2 [Butyrivibrio sp. INlla16]